MSAIENQFPIGKHEKSAFDADKVRTHLNHIVALPSLLEAAVKDLNEKDLQQTYRVGGWTIAQVVHHVADSHMNAFVRCKLILTEHRPNIKPYDQDLWAAMPDVTHVPINHSLTLIHALHTRWYELLKGLTTEQWSRVGIHPEHTEPLSMWDLLCLYAWHGHHHAYQILKWKESR